MFTKVLTSQHLERIYNGPWSGRRYSGSHQHKAVSRKNGVDCAIECYCVSSNVHDKMTDGKTAFGKRFLKKFDRATIHTEVRDVRKYSRRPEKNIVGSWDSQTSGQKHAEALLKESVRKICASFLKPEKSNNQR